MLTTGDSTELCNRRALHSLLHKTDSWYAFLNTYFLIYLLTYLLTQSLNHSPTYLLFFITSLSIGKNLSLSDLYDVDHELADTLKWTLDTDIGDGTDLDQRFTYEADVFGQRLTKDLKPDGSEMVVNEGNKKEYVRLFALAKMNAEIRQQIRAFRRGFLRVVSKKEIELFSESEMDILIAGEPEIDVSKLQKHCKLRSFEESHNVVKWFWEVVRGFDRKTLAAFLYFSSGEIFII